MTTISVSLRERVAKRHDATFTQGMITNGEASLNQYLKLVYYMEKYVETHSGRIGIDVVPTILTQRENPIPHEEIKRDFAKERKKVSQVAKAKGYQLYVIEKRTVPYFRYYNHKKRLQDVADGKRVATTYKRGRKPKQP